MINLWQEEKDPETLNLLSQAIRSNPPVNAPLVSKTWEQAKDEAMKKRLWELVGEMAVQDNQQEESRQLSALVPGASGTLEARSSAASSRTSCFPTSRGTS